MLNVARDGGVTTLTPARPERGSAMALAGGLSTARLADDSIDAALVQSAAKPGLVQRIRAYRAGLRSG